MLFSRVSRLVRRRIALWLLSSVSLARRMVLMLLLVQQIRRIMFLMTNFRLCSLPRL
nr:MAG TPA: hypothetical protein [Caudoviricetes sp.]